MDLNRIRNMSDEELTLYLKSLKSKNTNCVKCGKSNGNYTINVQNKNKMQQKKLCNLCNDCYIELLEHLGCNDILWD